MNKLFCYSLLIILTGFSTAESLAQVDGMAPILPVRGYIILKGDTIPGKLKWTLKYVENNPVEIKFTFENGSVETYKAGEIAGFGNNVYDYDSPVQSGWEHYVSMPSFKKGVPVFIKRLLDGKITVFLKRGSPQINTSQIVEHSFYDGIEFSFSSDGLSIGPSYRTEYTVLKERSWHTSYLVSKNNGPIILLDKNNYDSYFNELFNDCDRIKKELEKNPDLIKFRNFMILAEVYNQLCK